MKTTGSNSSNNWRNDLAFMVGLVIAAAGLIGYDWRIAAIIIGAVIAILAFLGTVKR